MVYRFIYLVCVLGAMIVLLACSGAQEVNENENDQREALGPRDVTNEVVASSLRADNVNHISMVEHNEIVAQQERDFYQSLTWLKLSEGVPGWLKEFIDTLALALLQSKQPASELGISRDIPEGATNKEALEYLLAYYQPAELVESYGRRLSSIELLLEDWNGLTAGQILTSLEQLQREMAELEETDEYQRLVEDFPLISSGHQLNRDRATALLRAFEAGRSLANE